MTDTELFDWIKSQNLTREETGPMLGYSKRTVDNWYSETKIPEPARQHLITIIKHSQHQQQPTGLRFTLEQWDAIERARRTAGFTDRTEFFTAALTDYANRHSSPDKITYFPPETGTGRVAEDTPETPSGKPPKKIS